MRPDKEQLRVLRSRALEEGEDSLQSSAQLRLSTSGSTIPDKSLPLAVRTEIMKTIESPEEPRRGASM